MPMLAAPAAITRPLSIASSFGYTVIRDMLVPQPGTLIDVVYLLHFDSPVNDHRPARHYLGTARDLHERLRQHRTGRGAKITAACADRGIGMSLARVWRGGRTLERRLKNRKNAPKLCPICRYGYEAIG